MRGSGIVKSVAGINILLAFISLLVLFDRFVSPRIPMNWAAEIVAGLILAAALLLWGLLYRSGKDAAKRVKNVADLFWNIWSYVGIYALARASILGHGGLQELLTSLTPGLLTVATIGVLMNAAVRIVIAFTEIYGFEKQS